MKKFYTTRLLYVIAIAAAAWACDNTDPLPMSVANFKVTSVAPEVNLPVQFENLSTNASSYVWDYGDGNKDSLVIDPMHTYTAPGTYSVKMTAYTEDGQKSESIQDVNVGERFLTSMFIINVNMDDPEGNPWSDDGSGVDVLFQLGPTDAEVLEDLAFVFIDSLNADEGGFSTPVGITSDDLIPQDYLLEDKDFFILLEAVDTVDNEPRFRTMAEIVFNPINVPAPPEDFYSISKNENGTGDIVIPWIVLGEYQFYLTFEIN